MTQDSQTHSALTSANNWLQVPVSIGSSSAVASRLEKKFKKRLELGALTKAEFEYVRDVDVSLCKRGLQVSDKHLEKLRRACQLFDVDLKQKEITSHRKFAGPFIVAAKKVMFPVLRMFLKDYMHQQRCFNAAVIDVLAELSSPEEQHKRSSGS